MKEIPAEDFGVYVVDTTEEVKEEHVIVPGYGIIDFIKVSTSEKPKMPNGFKSVNKL